VLSHTAGLPFFPVQREATAWADWDLLCADLVEAAVNA
jgi:CubicO group peptidase (beta-lactamase class C family)